MSAVTNGGVTVLYFKSCLRCKNGTVELGSDNFGSFLSCLTCGYTINSRSIRSNGSIEQPTGLENDVVVTPQLEPVAVLDEIDGTDEPDFDDADDDDEFEADDIDVIELERAAI
ncbi:MAG: hypothetical protein HN495_08430 [Chloroflexi bacterium]|nr:hypothetical protein [Chloroflexota bacterium]MBT7466700.1 hypothetical protein [Chloroflexota bacterium]